MGSVLAGRMILEAILHRLHGVVGGDAQPPPSALHDGF